MERECHPLLKPFIPVVKMLSLVLGPNYEVLLHDLSADPTFIVAIENPEVTGREIDTPMTDFGKYLIATGDAQERDFFANYSAEAADGRPLRSSVALIRDENRAVIGFLCINYDITTSLMLKDMAEFLTTVHPLTVSGASTEKFGHRQNDHLQELLDEVRQIWGKPLRYTSRGERRQIMKWLDDHGFFKIKKAMARLTSETGKSRFTLYADLRTIRAESGEELPPEE